VVFLDDDERPEPGWLEALVSTWERTGAAAVVGPVISTYAQEPEPWIAAGRFFDRRRLRTGTEITVAATNNLLLDVQQLAGLRFDLAFGITGGSDTLFTREIHRRGGRLVWCDEARVLDVVPAGRLTRGWVLRKALRTGNSWSRVTLALEPSTLRRLVRRAVLTAHGLVRIAGGLGRVLVGAVTRSLGQRARGARTVARGLGMAGGAWGHVVAEYRRPPSP
jgi:cellulose synthase/poly-beta-1,6-N-acetylglucosamine synthase-like glycosyltransferase